MKRKYSLDYLLRKFTPATLNQWTVAKCRELEQTTGVPWSFSDVNGGKRTFQAVMKVHGFEEVSDPEKVDRFLRSYSACILGIIGYVSYSDIQEHSDLTYPEVMGIAFHLIRSQKASPNVNRLGRNVYIRVKPEFRFDR